MPPKGASKAGTTEMSEDVYFFYASLRVLMAQSDQAPNWDLVAEAIGGNLKGHTLYCRIDKLKKTAVPAFGKDIPDLEQLIAKAVADRTIDKRLKPAGQKRAAPHAGKKAVKKQKKDMDVDEEEFVVKDELENCEDLDDMAV